MEDSSSSSSINSENRKNRKRDTTGEDREKKPLLSYSGLDRDLETQIDKELAQHYGDEDLYAFGYTGSTSYRCSATVKISVLVLVFVLLIGLVVVAVELIDRLQIVEPAWNLNIHVKLGTECERLAIALNEQVSELDRNQQIDLETKSQPHITLYMTDFPSTQVEDIVAAINMTLSSWLMKNTVKDCNVTLVPEAVLSGSYAFWDVGKSGCLQRLGDTLVNSTSGMIDKHARERIPSWVLDLPDHIRQRKIDMIRKYGSPNVFDEFDPHVTVAHDNITPDNLHKAFEQLEQEGAIPECHFIPCEIAIGRTGPFGTVSREQDVHLFSFAERYQGKDDTEWKRVCS